MFQTSKKIISGIEYFNIQTSFAGRIFSAIIHPEDFDWGKVGDIIEYLIKKSGQKLCLEADLKN